MEAPYVVLNRFTALLFYFLFYFPFSLLKEHLASLVLAFVQCIYQEAPGPRNGRHFIDVSWSIYTQISCWRERRIPTLRYGYWPGVLHYSLCGVPQPSYMYRLYFVQTIPKKNATCGLVKRFQQYCWFSGNDV